MNDGSAIQVRELGERLADVLSELRIDMHKELDAEPGTHTLLFRIDKAFERHCEGVLWWNAALDELVYQKNLLIGAQPANEP